MASPRGVLAVLPVLACLAGLAAPGPAAGAAPERPGVEWNARERVAGQSFLTFNIAGGTQHGGRVEPVVSEVVGAVRGRRARGALLNEVCGTQARALRQRLPRYEVHFFRTSDRRCGGRSQGNVVIAARGSVRMGGASRALPSGDSIERHVGCVRMSPTASAVVCGTHLSFEGRLYQVRERQARIVTRIAERLVGRGLAVVVGGDLNAVPTSPLLRHFYSRAYPRGDGRLRESAGCCRRTGPGTTPDGRRIDYLFFSPAWVRVGSDVVPTRRSDHYKVWVRLRRR